jgi:hypothetical protein
VCFSGVFSGLLGGRLEGVEVCAPELDDVDCQITDADGGWKMKGLPLDSDVLVTATYEETVPTILPQHSTMDWYDWYKTMVPQSIMNTNANRLDVEMDPERGHILFLAWEALNLDGENAPNVTGVTATLMDGSDGSLFYAGGMGLADADATETSGSGSGGVINLPPGTHRLAFEGPGGACTEHSFHWLADETGAVPVPVQAGFTTAIDVICPP